MAVVEGMGGMGLSVGVEVAGGTAMCGGDGKRASSGTRCTGVRVVEGGVGVEAAGLRWRGVAGNGVGREGLDRCSSAISMSFLA